MSTNKKIECDKCLTVFDTKSKVKSHQKSKYCKNYVNVLFTCTKCLYTTIGIKKINSHVLECTGKYDKNIGTTLMKEVTNLKETISNQVDQIDDLNAEIDSGENTVEIEKKYKKKIRLLKEQVTEQVTEQVAEQVAKIKRNATNTMNKFVVNTKLKLENEMKIGLQEHINKEVQKRVSEQISDHISKEVDKRVVIEVKDYEISMKETMDTMIEYSTKEIKKLKEENKKLKEDLKTKSEDEMERKNITTTVSKTSIANLKSKLKMEKFKSKLYKHLIIQNTSIKLCDIIEEKNDGIHVYNKGNLSIFMHTVKDKIIIKDKIKKDKIIIKDKIKELEYSSKSSRFRHIKGQITISNEDDNELIRNMAKDKHNEIISKIPRYNMTTHNNSFNNYMEKLRTEKTYTSTLKSICKLNNKMLGSLNIEEYKEKVASQEKQVLDHFLAKNMPKKRLRDNVNLCVNAVDTRLSRIYDEEAFITCDHLCDLKNALRLSTIHEEKYVEYNFGNIINQFLNYGTAVFSMQYLIELYLVNSFGYNNIIYVPLNSSSKDDPFSFYTLTKIFRKKRQWSLDCRLKRLAEDFFSKVLEYLKLKFRELYGKFCRHNDYKKDFIDDHQYMYQDCKQMIINMRLLTNKKRIRKLLCSIIKKNCTYIPTENDCFNMFSDDSAKEVKVMDEGYISMTDVACDIFDNISTEDVEHFLRLKCEI